MFTVKESIGNFFYTQSGELKQAIDKAVAANLSKWGAFVRTDARTSLRYRNRPSEPGQPPSAHRTMTRTKTNRKGETKVQGVSPLRDFLFFAYDPSSKTVVVGPAKLSGKLGNAPETLEYGGTSQVRTTVWENHKRVASVRTARIRPRPYMHPAEARTRGKLGDIWANSIKR